MPPVAVVRLPLGCLLGGKGSRGVRRGQVVRGDGVASRIRGRGGHFAATTGSAIARPAAGLTESFC
jgi:hypothetical protein